MQKLSFRKQESSGLAGLIFKQIVCRGGTLNKVKDCPNAILRDFSLLEEFKGLTNKDIVRLLEQGAELWVTLKKIQHTASNRSDQESRLREDFENANDYFIHKMEALQGELNLKKVLQTLGPARRVAQDQHDGLSSQ